MDTYQYGSPGSAGASGTLPGQPGGKGGPGGSAYALIDTNPADQRNTARALGGYGGPGGAGGGGPGTGGAGGAGGAGGYAKANTNTYRTGGYLYDTSSATGGVGGAAGLPGNYGATDSGAGADGGAGGTAVAHAREFIPGGAATGKAYATGGAGGNGAGAGYAGGAGGVASGSTAAVYGTSGYARVAQTGGAGGGGTLGAVGGAGADSTLTNAVTGQATSGSLTLVQAATGGAGGYAVGANAGRAGDADSVLTFDDVTINPATPATSLSGTSGTQGGAGGMVLSSGGTPTAGGAANASIDLTGAQTVRATASATGGAGGGAQGMFSSPGANGAAGGAATGSSVAASGAGPAYAIAKAYGGGGGESDAAGDAGGAGGIASGTTAKASGQSAYAAAFQTGGAGGYGYNGASGGAGGGSYLNAAVSGSTTGGSLQLSQSASGGAGGNSYNARGGQGGYSVSKLTFDDTANPIHASALSGGSSATGGAGGGGSGSPGAGGSGYAFIRLSGINAVGASANAIGGAGGRVGGVYAGTGGTATATSAAIAAGGGPGYGSATAQAMAVGGAGPTQGSAYANASAVGQAVVAANATATGGAGLAGTGATVNASGAVSSVDADATAPVQGLTQASSTAQLGTIAGFAASENAYSFATVMPSAAGVNSVFAANPNVAAAFHGDATAVFGAGTEGALYVSTATGARTYAGNVTWTLDTTSLSGDFTLGLVGTQSEGPAFQTVRFDVVVGTTTVLDDTFNSLAAAQAFFTDRPVGLGAVPSAPTLSLSVNYFFTADSIGSGFATEFLLGTASPPCFAAGTRILADGGELAVETLRPGDRVRTRSGWRDVAWLGRRHVDIDAHPRPEEVRPIRICRGAVAEDVPHRDLLVSPDHAIFVGGSLVPARLLVNGGTIVPDRGMRATTYFHVELDAHDVLFAEGLPSESYLDTGNRAAFENAGTSQGAGKRGACVPVATDAATVEPIWRRLADRSVALGHAAFEPAGGAPSDTRLLVGERMARPVSSREKRLVFVVPREAAGARIVSRAARPNERRPWLNDRRRLGLSVERIVLCGTMGRQEIALDSPHLCRGWHAVERDGARPRRWTDGAGELALPLGTMSVEVVIGAEAP